MIELKEVHIPDTLYLTTKLEPKTVQKVLGSSVSTVDRLFCIANNAPAKIDLIDEKVNGLIVKMYVKIDYSYAGEARRQVNNIRSWRQLIRRKPGWILRVIIEDVAFVVQYKFEHRYTKIDHLHRDIVAELESIQGRLNTETKTHPVI